MGKQASYSAIAKEYGISSTTTRSFSSKISSARQFGLIAVENQVAKLTDDGKRLIFPTSTDETKRIRIKCFCSPPLYRKLIDRYEGKALPSQTALENLLLHEYGISTAAKTTASQMFLHSIEQLALSQSGILVLDAETEDTITVVAEDSEAESIASDYPLAANNRTALNKEQYHRFEVPTMRPGITATVLIPSDLSELDLDFVLQSFNFMFPKFIENLKQNVEPST